jgi:cell division protein FtsB
MKFAKWMMILAMSATMCAQTAQSVDSTRTRKPAVTTKEPAVTAADVKALRDALAEQKQQMATQQQQITTQQQEIRQLREELLRRTEGGLAMLRPAAEVHTASPVTPAIDPAAFAALQSSMADMKANLAAVAGSFQDEQKRVGELEQPLKLHFRGIDITPGGFAEATGIYRTRNENADVSSSWGSLPFGGTPNAALSELHGSARHSRLSMLAETKVGGIKATGYWEMDFLGAAPTSNEVQSNSFNPRQRQLWARAELSNGFSFLGGQSWSLLTLNKKGIEPRTEWAPATIDAQYAVGFNFARQLTARFTKNLNNKTWFAFSVENPETTLSVLNGPANVFGFNSSSNATSPNSGFVLNNTLGANGVSTDLAPDLIAKVAFEPGWGHYEVKALGRFFRDRISGHNNVTTGGGIGFGAMMPVTKKIDWIVQGMAGQGIGRYAAANGPDVTLRPDGTVVPLHTYEALTGVEVHPTPKLDLYLYGGGEYWGRSVYRDPASGKLVGYGVQTAVLSGCSLETPSSTQLCQAVNKDVWQVQPGFWYRIFKGREGAMQMGMSYSYTYRTVWPGIGGNPKGIENVIMSSFRYYLP